MTKLFEEAIAQVRQLPEADQNVAAEILLTLATRPDRLDPATRVPIREGRVQARRGEFAGDEAMSRLLTPKA